MAMRLSFLLLALTAPGLTAPGPIAAAQTPPAAVQGYSQPGNSSTPAPLPSVALQSPIDVLKQALASTTPDKWKGSAPMRTEAVTNLSSIRRDIETTLPRLLTVADATPDSVSRLLPAYRNIEALYDVLLRVVTTARVAAPAEQISALEQAQARLEDARRDLGDWLQADADTGEKKMSNLQAALKAIPPPAPPLPPVVCPAPTPAKKKAKPAAKPVATPLASQSSAAPSP
jgi:hypothetical protein